MMEELLMRVKCAIELLENKPNTWYWDFIVLDLLRDVEEALNDKQRGDQGST